MNVCHTFTQKLVNSCCIHIRIIHEQYLPQRSTYTGSEALTKATYFVFKLWKRQTNVKTPFYIYILFQHPRYDVLLMYKWPKNSKTTPNIHLKFAWKKSRWARRPPLGNMRKIFVSFFFRFFVVCTINLKWFFYIVII